MVLARPRRRRLKRHLLFDLDGTLIDSLSAIEASVERTLDDLDVPRSAAAAVRAHVGAPLAQVFARILGPDRAGLIDPAIARYRLHFEDVGMPRLRLFPGIAEAMDAFLAAGHAMQLVTARSAPSAAGILRQLGLGRYFAHVHAPDPAARGYDKADHVRAALERGGIPAPAALFVGDRADDVRAAAAHGVRAVGVLWGNGSREELESAGAVHLVADAPSLVAWVGSDPVVASTRGSGHG